MGNGLRPGAVDNSISIAVLRTVIDRELPNCTQAQAVGLPGAAATAATTAHGRSRVSVDGPAGARRSSSSAPAGTRARWDDPDWQPELRELGDDFRGQVMASAIRDRVVHHAVAIEHPGWFVSVEGRA